jgi:hypothetical protein
MPICETCGNDYDKAFQVRLNGEDHIFDSFECANPGPRAEMPALWNARCRPWSRERRQDLLLRSLR